MQRLTVPVEPADRGKAEAFVRVLEKEAIHSATWRPEENKSIECNPSNIDDNHHHVHKIIIKQSWSIKIVLQHITVHKQNKDRPPHRHDTRRPSRWSGCHSAQSSTCDLKTRHNMYDREPLCNKEVDFDAWRMSKSRPHHHKNYYILLVWRLDEWQHGILKSSVTMSRNEINRTTEKWRKQLPWDTRIICCTRSSPVMPSVIGCSTCKALDISEHYCQKKASLLRQSYGDTVAIRITTGNKPNKLR